MYRSAHYNTVTAHDMVFILTVLVSDLSNNHIIATNMLPYCTLKETEKGHQ